MPGRRRGSRKTAGSGYPQYSQYNDPFSRGYSDTDNERGPGRPTALFWWAIAHRVWLAPFIAGGGVILTANALHSARKGLIIAIVVGAVASVAMWLLAHRKWEGAEITYARWCTVAASVWAILATSAGLSKIMLLVFVVGWAPAALVWLMHKLPRPKKPDPLRDHWAARWEEVARGRRINLAGSQVIEAKGDENFPQLLLQLLAGEQTIDEVRSAVPLIEGAWHLPPGSIRVTKTKDASQAWLNIRKITKIEGVVRWTPANMPTSVTQPFWIARNEAGEDVFASMLYVNYKGVGMTRWGKSNLIDVILAACAYCDDVVAIFIDLKQGRTARIWLPLLGGFAATYDEAVVLVRALNKMREERSLTHGGSRQVVISKDCPAYLLIIDEMAAGVGNEAPDSRLLDELLPYAAQGAGLGFTLVGFGQDGSLETWSTEKLRAACGRGFSFKVDKDDHASYVLKNAKNANPSAITRKGVMIYNDGAADSEQLRTPWMEPDEDKGLIARIVAERAGLMHPGDPKLEAAGGAVWRDRWMRLPREFWQDASPEQRAIAEAAHAAAQAADGGGHHDTAVQDGGITSGGTPTVSATTAAPAAAIPMEETTLPSNGRVDLTLNSKQTRSSDRLPALVQSGEVAVPVEERAREATAEVMAISDRALPADLFAQVQQLVDAGELDPLPDLKTLTANGSDNVARLLAASGAGGLAPRELYYPKGKPDPRLMGKSWVMGRLQYLRERQIIEPVPGAPAKSGQIRPVKHADPAAAYREIKQAFADLIEQANAPVPSS